MKRSGNPSVAVRSAISRSPTGGRVRQLLRKASRLTPVRDGAREISVYFCGDRRMRTLNRRYRRQDRATDVLAFPASDRSPLLGDIVVSVPYAARQARRRREPLAAELDRLLVHGYLHLLGYDHETDEGEMDALEARLRRRLGIAERG
jgi:probable rRNA maturation factor